MTQRTDATATADSDALLQQLRQLDNAPIFQRGDAAVRLAAVTVAVIRRLEARISLLEDADNVSQSNS